MIYCVFLGEFIALSAHLLHSLYDDGVYVYYFSCIDFITHRAFRDFIASSFLPEFLASPHFSSTYYYGFQNLLPPISAESSWQASEEACEKCHDIDVALMPVSPLGRRVRPLRSAEYGDFSFDIYRDFMRRAMQDAWCISMIISGEISIFNFRAAHAVIWAGFICFAALQHIMIMSFIYYIYRFARHSEFPLFTLRILSYITRIKQAADASPTATKNAIVTTFETVLSADKIDDDDDHAHHDFLSLSLQNYFHHVMAMK